MSEEATVTAAPELARFIDPDQVKVDISINPSDLDSAMLQHAGLELHYMSRTADARRQYERIKAAAEIIEANLDTKHRELFAAEGKKTTEAQIKAAIAGDPKFSKTQQRLIDAQHIWKLCEAADNSFRSRKDMLLEVARDRRKEKEGQLRVMEQKDAQQKFEELMRNKVVSA